MPNMNENEASKITSAFQISKEMQDDLYRQRENLLAELEEVNTKYNEASSEGDARENAALDAAKSERFRIRQQLNTLEHQIDSAVVVSDETYHTMVASEAVQLMTPFVIECTIGTFAGKAFEFTLMPAGMAQYPSSISTESLLGQNVLGKKCGDTVKYSDSRNITQEFKILRVGAAKK